MFQYEISHTYIEIRDILCDFYSRCTSPQHSFAKSIIVFVNPSFPTVAHGVSFGMLVSLELESPKGTAQLPIPLVTKPNGNWSKPGKCRPRNSWMQWQCCPDRAPTLGSPSETYKKSIRQTTQNKNRIPCLPFLFRFTRCLWHQKLVM